MPTSDEHAPASTEVVIDVVTRFARSLDREDYDATAALLAPACAYRIRGTIHRGPEAILASYRGNGDAAAVAFDEIRYGSAVRAAGPGRGVVTFSDHLRQGGRRLDHFCEQLVEVDARGAIVGIEHRDLPGERERLEAFRRAIATAREASGSAD